MMATTANQVLADTRNKAPFFPDLDDEMDGDQTDAVRSVRETVPMIGMNVCNLPRSETVGAPVTAMDFITMDERRMQSPEILTYTLGGPDADVVHHRPGQPLR